jgi:hypothetical protein
VALKNAQNVLGMYVDEKDDGLSFRNYGNLLLLGGGGHRTGKKGGGYKELLSNAKNFYKDAFKHDVEKSQNIDKQIDKINMMCHEIRPLHMQLFGDE